jgi:hypothetical protein
MPCGTLGKLRTWSVAGLGITRETFAQWEAEIPDSSDAMGLAMDRSRRCWEDAGHDGLPGAVNAALWSRSMTARLSANWREKRIEVGLPAVTSIASPIEAQVIVSSTISKAEPDIESGAVLARPLAGR